MIDLTTKYMGLTLKNPIIIGSCGLTNSTESIKKLEANGAAGVVLKSIFEEQILMESDSMKHGQVAHTEEADYINYYTRQHHLDEYLKLVENTKKQVSIPVIASINCVSSSEWTSFAKKIQDAGADALELNMFIMPGNSRQKGEEIERIYFDIISEVRKHITLPLALKIGFYFSGLANMIFNLSVRKINAIVLFNRFYQPDIDLDKMEITSADVFSTPQENALPLRWIGMMADEVKCDLASTTGIHDGLTIIKNLLAGAKAVQIATVIYQKGPEHINVMLDQIKKWMEKNNYSSLQKIIGKLSQARIKDPVLYERSQFMRYFSSKRYENEQ
jgi:dihydroorotate dehydrogenase (fumarate)